MRKEAVTKLDVAKRQMNEGICLFFEQRDLIPIHTLAAAAAQVLSDLCRKRGIHKSLRDGRMINPERRSEWLRAMKEPENFFKHADRDSDAVHDFNPVIVEMILFDATLMYRLLTERLTYEAFVFQFWFSHRNPYLVLEGEDKNAFCEESKHLDIDINDLKLFRQMIRDRHELPPNISWLVD